MKLLSLNVGRPQIKIWNGKEICTSIFKTSVTVTVANYVESYYSKGSDKKILDMILSIPYLPERQRKAFETFK